MTGDRRGSSTVHVDRLDATHGGVGMQFHVGAAVQRRGSVPSTAGEPPFTGRDDELRDIEDKLQTQRVVVISGAPGLGKSRLAFEYAHSHSEAYPGGMFLIPFEQSPPVDLAELVHDADGSPTSDEPIEDRCRRALRTVGGAGRTLLIYDAIADERVLHDWLPYAGNDWHVIATSTSALWARAWSRIDMRPLREDAEHTLVRSILGRDADDRLVARIATRAAGITVELCATAAAVYRQLYLGYTVEDVAVELSREATSSFETAWALLSPEARLGLQVASTFVTARFPSSLVTEALQRVGWSARAVDSAIDEARIRQLATRDGRHLQVHQLISQFVRARAPLDEPIRRSLFQGLLHCAREFSEHPGDLEWRALMLPYSYRVEDWATLVTNGSEWPDVGSAILELGQFAQALPWFERAVAAAEKGDVHGRVDSESLGRSLHLAGYCYSRQGRFAQALPWFERAVTTAEKGDVHGRVDSESLGRSLHQVGFCYARQGQFAQALPWFKRAFEAKEKGDMYGRADSESLGMSLHQVGYCYASQGQFVQALPWFERAAEAKEKGNVHGHVDSASLGMSLHQVGICYGSQGQFSQALPWFMRAVEAAEKGDVHGRVDSESLGVSLRMVGDCYARQGQFAQALPWFERAVAAAEKGDVHGRVDSESLGRSLQQVGLCYSSQSQFAQALPWLERAIAAKERGNVHGRMDSESLGRSLQQVGLCYSSQSQFAQALPWFERAVEAKEKGDVHGRVDSQSLGTSLQEVGVCYARQGEFAQALPWFERAVTAKEKGDVHGRVDSQSLGLSLQAVGDCYEHLGQSAQAQTWFQRAIAVDEKDEGT